MDGVAKLTKWIAGAVRSEASIAEPSCVADGAMRAVVAASFDGRRADDLIFGSAGGSQGSESSAARFDRLLGGDEWRETFVKLAARQAAAAGGSLVLRYAGDAALRNAASVAATPHAALIASAASFDAFERVLSDLVVELAAAQWSADPLLARSAVDLAIAAARSMVEGGDAAQRELMSGGAAAVPAHDSSARFESAQLREMRWRYGGAWYERGRVADDVVGEIVHLATRHAASFLYAWRLLSALRSTSAGAPPRLRGCAGRLLQQLELEVRAALQPVRADQLLHAAALVASAQRAPLPSAAPTSEQRIACAARRLCIALGCADAVELRAEEAAAVANGGAPQVAPSVVAALGAMDPLLRAALEAGSTAALAAAAAPLRRPRVIDSLVAPFFPAALGDGGKVDLGVDGAEAESAKHAALVVGLVASVHSGGVPAASGARSGAKRKRESGASDGAYALKDALLECARAVARVLARLYDGGSGSGGSVAGDSGAQPSLLAAIAELEQHAVRHPLLAREVSRWCARMFAADESRKLMLEPQEQRNPPRLCSDADLALMRADDAHLMQAQRDVSTGRTTPLGVRDTLAAEPASLLRVLRRCAAAYPQLRGAVTVDLLSLFQTCDDISRDSFRKSTEEKSKARKNDARARESSEGSRFRKDLRLQQMAVLSSAVHIALHRGGGSGASAGALGALWPLLRFLIGSPVRANASSGSVAALLCSDIDRRHIVVHGACEMLAGAAAVAPPVAPQVRASTPPTSTAPLAPAREDDAAAFALLRLVTLLPPDDLAAMGALGAAAKAPSSASLATSVWTPLMHRYGAAGELVSQRSGRKEAQKLVKQLVHRCADALGEARSETCDIKALRGILARRDAVPAN